MSENLYDISGKVAIITGGGGVLGGSIAEYLAKQNVKVVILDLNAEAARAKADELTKGGGQALGLGGNVLDENSLNAAKEEIVNRWGRIDFLVNAAGGNMPDATVKPDETIFDIPISATQKVLDLNLMGSVIPTIIFGKVMAEQKYGSVINISSMASTQSITRVLGYSMAKSGIDIFTKWMALEMAQKFSDKIRINAIAPGFFIGNQNRHLLTNEDGSYTDRGNLVVNNTPMKRFGDITELNGTVHYLLSNAAGFVTGSIVPVDGGFSSFSGV
jgi:NAD(P)-dependent dehydrogenase (short-subunit alcohol dehydrogenase family)